MLFECGHDELFGKGKLCRVCDKLPQDERTRILTNIRLNKKRKNPKPDKAGLCFVIFHGDTLIFGCWEPWFLPRLLVLQ